jgi:hypothetical protein
MAIRIPTDPVGGWSAIHELEIYDILQIWDYEMASNHGITVFFLYTGWWFGTFFIFHDIYIY